MHSSFPSSCSWRAPVTPSCGRSLIPARSPHPVRASPEQACQTVSSQNGTNHSTAGDFCSHAFVERHDATSDVQHLRTSIQKLVTTVQAQQRTLAEQQETIQQLQGTIQQLKTEQAPAQQQGSSGSANWNGSSSWNGSIRPFDAQQAALFDRRSCGMFDARYHSTSRGATPSDTRLLPDRIILVRHAQSEGNINNQAYTSIPDPQVPLTPLGWQQAHEAGHAIRRHMEAAKGGTNYQLYFYTSPYKRSLQTYEGIRDAFASSQVCGVQEEVQLREQDFGNFQDAEGKQREKQERLRFGRFFYRFPNGESGADVYDRITVFTDHLIRDINAGRFGHNTSLVLVTHGLALRIFLMRWFHWSVDQFMQVYNPPNGVPLVLEKVNWGVHPNANNWWMHTKSFYRLSSDSMAILQGCTLDMCTISYLPSSARMAPTSGGLSSIESPSDLMSPDPANACDQSAADQWAEFGGGW